MSPAVSNLIALYERNPTREADLAWYADAKREVAKRAQAHGLPVKRYAAVVAATSPMTQWHTVNGAWPNLDAADRAVRWHRGELESPRMLKTSANNSARILDGADPMAVLGPKTRAFWRALLGHDDVVLDRWALRAIGWPRESVTEAEVPTASEPYFAAAAILNVKPSALQAATWAQIRRES